MAANSFTKWLKPAITTWSGEGKCMDAFQGGFWISTAGSKG